MTQVGVPTFLCVMGPIDDMCVYMCVCHPTYLVREHSLRSRCSYVCVDELHRAQNRRFLPFRVLTVNIGTTRQRDKNTHTHKNCVNPSLYLHRCWHRGLFFTSDCHNLRREGV